METDYRPEIGIKKRYGLTEPLVILMKDGVELRIDSATFEYRKTLSKQLASGEAVEIKFCVRDDEEIDGTDTREQWELVYFPKFDKEGDEILHLSVVDFEDSITNGNLMYYNGAVRLATSNHRDPGYANYETPITEFAAKTLNKLLDDNK